VSALKIRSATASDAAAVAAIYNEGIEDRQATFETRPSPGSPTTCRSSSPPTAARSSAGRA
jgi:L-amino acid N-acyltransferase YncA